MPSKKENEDLESILKQLDKAKKKLNEEEISKRLNDFIDEKYDEDPPKTILAEQIAFDFVEDYPEDKNTWNTYFGPMFTLSGKEYPSIKKITPKIINYWEKRADESEHPILKARYSNLVWDFTEEITEEHPSHKIGQIFIDTVIEITNNDLHKDETNVIKKLERALNIALELNDKNRIESLKSTIIDYEKRIRDDEKSGLYGFSYTLLVKNKKIKLDTTVEKEIIEDLEEILNQQFEKEDIYSIQRTVYLLSDYFNRNDQKEKLKDLICRYLNILYEKAKEETAIQYIHPLEELYQLCLDYGLKELKDDIAIKLKELGPNVKSSLKQIKTQFDISQNDIDQHVDLVLQNYLKKSIERIVLFHIPKREKIEKQIKKNFKKAPVPFLISRDIIDHKGRHITTLESIKKDKEGHIIDTIQKNIIFGSVFLRESIDALIKKFDLDVNQIIDFLYESPIFHDSQRVFLHEGLKAYLDENYIISLHILTPQIEEIIRNFVELTDGSVLKPYNGGFHYKTLGTLLRDDSLEKVIGSNSVLYLQVLLTEDLGLNIRNRISHGISNESMFSQITADRVFHSLLLLSLIRINDNQKDVKKKI